jgi:hypothetical protein
MTKESLPPWAEAWIASSGGELDEYDAQLLNHVEEGMLALDNLVILEKRVEGPREQPELVIIFKAAYRPECVFGYRLPLHHGEYIDPDGLSVAFIEMNDRADRRRRLENVECVPGQIAWI